MRPHTHAFSVLAAIAAFASTSSSARAQEVDDDIIELIRADLTRLSVNTPIWLAEHLPSMMSPVGTGAGAGIGDDSGGFSLGLVTRLGLFNNFDDVGNGLDVVDVQGDMPSVLPWPQVGIVLGANLGKGFELGGDFQFLPETDISTEDAKFTVAMLQAAVGARFRANKAEGAVPAFVIGCGASYYRGVFKAGTAYSNRYSETVEGQVVEGTVTVETAPAVEWSLFQISPEIRLAWDIGGVFRPYLGIGLGLTFGDVSDRVHVRATATLDSVAGQPQNEQVEYDADIVSFTTDPALYALRPHVGFDIVAGIFAFTFQLDLAVMGKNEIDSDLGDAADSFDPDDGNYLFNQNSRGSQTQAALIGTLALRLQF